jgi:hypothetical protein
MKLPFPIARSLFPLPKGDKTALPLSSLKIRVPNVA